MSLDKIKEKVYAGERLSAKDGLELFNSNDLLAIGEMASHVCQEKNGNYAYFVNNRHINHTNVCVNRCKFCAFSRDIGDKDAYTMSIDEIIKKTDECINSEITELHIVGGLHPDLEFDYYLDIVRKVKEKYPRLHIQAFTAVELDYFTKISGLSIEEVLLGLKEAGLGSIPGGGAEIFNKAVRNSICEEKTSGKRWLEVMEKAHNIGLKANSTMLYGHVESYKDRIDHLLKLRELQDRTGGFQAFIPLAFHPENTEICKNSLTTGFDDLKTLAISRLMLDNFDHIKAFWIMLGEKISQVSLSFGVDDIDGTVIEEKITHAAGATTGQALTKEQLINMIKEAGKIPVERDTVYNKIRVYE